MQPYLDALQRIKIDISTAQDMINTRVVQAKQVQAMDDEAMRLDEVQRNARNRLPYALDRPELLQYLDSIMPNRQKTEFVESQKPIYDAPFREIWVSVQIVDKYEVFEQILQELHDGNYMCQVGQYTIAHTGMGVDATMMLCFLTHTDVAWETGKAPVVQEIPGGKANPFD